MKDFCEVCGDGESSFAHDYQNVQGGYHPFKSHLETLCKKCGVEEWFDNRDGMCIDCYNAESGPGWEPRYDGGSDGMYRANMIDAGRSYLLL